MSLHRRLILPALGVLAVVAGCSASTEDDADSASAVSTLPSFRVIWARGEGRLRVTTASGDRVLWEASDKNLVRAAMGHESVKSARGCFVLDDRTERTCGGAVIESVDSDGAGTVARGRLEECGGSFELHFREVSKRQVGFELRVRSRSGDFNRATLAWVSPANEHFFGFGHQYGPLDMKGRKLPIWAGEQGIGRGAQPISGAISLVAGGCAGNETTTYTAVPAYVSTAGHGLVLENSEYLTFDFRARDQASVEVWSNVIRGRILDAPTPLEGLTSMTEYTGRMEPLPAWTQQGALLRSRGGSQAARATLAKAKSAGAKIAALWLEDWAGERETSFGLRMLWNWDVDRTLYPDWEQLIRELSAEGVRVLAYFNPFLADPAGWPGERRSLYGEAKDRGLLVKKADGSIYAVGNGGFEAGLVDLTNSAARTFLKDVMKKQLALGVSGWMADFGEALPYDAKLSSGVPASQFHNEFTYEWARLNREAMKEAGRDADGLFFNRSGNARSPGQTRAFWIGDQNTTWDDKDGIKTVIPALMAGGMSGYTINHMDVGGWLSLTIPFVGFTRNKELEQRWLELGAFGALYRLHHTNKPNDNWQWDSDAETLQLFARMTRLFAALAPYRAELMSESASRGWPLVRHPLLHHADDPNVIGLERQMMIGSELMAAPVLDPGKTTVDVYLPAGEWTSVWSNVVYGDARKGGYVKVPAPIGEPPILAKRGSKQGEALVQRLRAEGLIAR